MVILSIEYAYYINGQLNKGVGDFDYYLIPHAASLLLFVLNWITLLAGAESYVIYTIAQVRQSAFRRRYQGMCTPH